MVTRCVHVTTITFYKRRKKNYCISKITSEDALKRLFCLPDSELDSCVKFDSSKLSSGGLCEKALTLSEALLSEEDDFEGKSLAFANQNKRL